MYTRIRSFIDWKGNLKLSTARAHAHIDELNLFTEMKRNVPGSKLRLFQNVESDIRNNITKLATTSLAFKKSEYTEEEGHEVREIMRPIITAKDLSIFFCSWFRPVLNIYASNIRLNVIFENFNFNGNNIDRFFDLLPPKPTTESYPKIGTVDVKKLTIAVYSTIEILVDKLPKQHKKGDRRVLLAEFEIHSDVLDIIRQATSEAGSSGTDQLHLYTIIDRVLELSKNITFSDGYVLAISRQLQQIDQKLSEMDILRENVLNFVSVWQNHISEHSKRIWSKCQHNFLENLEKKKNAVGSLFLHIDRLFNTMGRNTEQESLKVNELKKERRKGNLKGQVGLGNNLLRIF